MNFLEELISEYYSIQGYLIIQNIRINPRKNGGHKNEIDILVFHPCTKQIIHIETSSDNKNRKDKIKNFKHKFKIDEQKIKKLFGNTHLPNSIKREGIILHGSPKKYKDFELISVQKYINDIIKYLEDEKYSTKKMVPEKYPLIRMILFTKLYHETKDK